MSLQYKRIAGLRRVSAGCRLDPVGHDHDSGCGMTDRHQVKTTPVEDVRPSCRSIRRCEEVSVMCPLRAAVTLDRLIVERYSRSKLISLSQVVCPRRLVVALDRLIVEGCTAISTNDMPESVNSLAGTVCQQGSEVARDCLLVEGCTASPSASRGDSTNAQSESVNLIMETWSESRTGESVVDFTSTGEAMDVSILNVETCCESRSGESVVDCTSTGKAMDVAIKSVSVQETSSSSQSIDQSRQTESERIASGSQPEILPNYRTIVTVNCLASMQSCLFALCGRVMAEAAIDLNKYRDAKESCGTEEVHMLPSFEVFTLNWRQTYNKLTRAVSIPDPIGQAAATVSQAGVEQTTTGRTTENRVETVRVGAASSASTVKPSGKLQLRKEMRVGTWNVRTLNGKEELMALEAARLGMDLLGLAETRTQGNGIRQLLDGQILITSSHDTQLAKGVGVWLSKRAASALLGYNPVSERIMTVRLQGAPFNITYVQVYAPTNQATDVDKEWFYEKLNETLKTIPRTDVVIIGGDFNAKLGKGNPVGKHAPGEINDNGERLSQFCLSNGFLAANAMVARHPRRMITWLHPDAHTKNQIDFLLVQKRWSSSLTKCRAFPGADLPGSDHLLVAGTLHLKLKVLTKPERKPMWTFSTESLVNYQIDVANRFASLEVEPMPDCMSSDAQWESMKEVIQTSAAKTLTSRAPPRKTWISSKTMDLIEAKRAVRRNTMEHRELTKRVKQAVLKDRNAVLTETCKAISEAERKSDSKGMFNLINRFTKRVAPKCSNIRDENGKLLTEMKGILDRWQRYCSELYRGSSEATEEDVSPEFSVGDEPVPLFEEVEKALKSIHAGKANGPDGIPIELLQNGGIEVKRRLYKIIVAVWSTGKWPKDWCESTCIPIPKKGDATKCENYRTLSLVSHASKVLLNIILERVRSKMEEETASEQAGFRMGRGTHNHLVSLKVMTEKARANNCPLHFCFVDMQRAFDSVSHSKLWKALRGLGFSEHVIALVKNLYDNGTSRVRIDGRRSLPFEPRVGTRQGCPLSPYLFNIFAEVMMRMTLEGFKGGMRIGGIRVSNLRYADDIVLIAESVEDLQELVKRMQGACDEMGLVINVGKTSAMSLNSGKLAIISAYGKQIPYSARFKYLGALFNTESSGSMDIN
jgi:hypothetical protein